MSTHAKITHWPSLLDTSGTVHTVDWQDLFARFGHWRPFAGDQRHPGWSAAEFDPPLRKAENVKSVCALVLDYDNGTPLGEVCKVWQDFYGLVHTTRKHTPEANRCRVILPFERPVTPAEYERIWRLKAPYGVDQAPKDPSRFWYLPGSADEATFDAIPLIGVRMNPDEILAQPDPRAQERPAPRQSDDGARASAYLAKMPPSISGAKGHQALWSAALVLVRGFGLSETDALALLESEFNPRCQPAWRRRELAHKVRDAANARKVPFGYKLDEGRDWSPTPASIPRRDPDADPIADTPEAQDDRGDAWEPPEEAGAAQAPQERQREPSPRRAQQAPEDPIQRFAVRSVGELLNGVYTRSTTERKHVGVSSGVTLIDRMIGGFRRGMCTILGASTSWGKSSFAILTSETAKPAGHRVLLISAEDTEDTYGARIMARRSGVNALWIRDNAVDAAGIGRMAEALAHAENDPFFINAIGMPVETIAEAITALCAKRDYDLVMVDYIQAITCKATKQDRRNEVSYIAQTLTSTIKRAGTSGLIFSQIKRIEENRMPTKHDLKESGDVENMAEHILMGGIIKDHPSGGLAAEWHRRILIEKNKDGPVGSGSFELEFDHVTASFTGRIVNDNEESAPGPSKTHGKRAYPRSV